MMNIASFDSSDSEKQFAPPLSLLPDLDRLNAMPSTDRRYVMPPMRMRGDDRCGRMGGGASGAQARSHFHLLSDIDIQSLRPVLEAVLARKSELVRNWYEVYRQTFGDSRALAEPEFVRIAEFNIETANRALLAGDVNEYESAVTRAAEALSELGVPLEEVIISLQLLKERVRAAFSADGCLKAALGTAFDRLNQVSTLLFVLTYVRTHSALEGTRIAALESAAARLPAASRNRFHGLVGASAGMRRLYERIELAAAANGNLLVVGESGTGKELVARAIHECGSRKDKPFVALNCAALPKDLIESELFGYKRGAFSGANNDHMGLFRAAEGGTLFLDEITEMDAATQTKLLRAIQERAIRPVGSAIEQPVNVRLIASTNRDPRAAVADGHLREDLYYRLQASVLEIPPLRDRREDIPLLVDHFISVFNQRLGRNVAGIEQRALDAITAHAWPGNVRELSNTIEAAFTFGRNSIIVLEDLPDAIVSAQALAASQRPEPPAANQQQKGVPSFAEAERALIENALASTRGNKVAAAEMLGISRKKLYAKIEKYGLASSTR